MKRKDKQQLHTMTITDLTSQLRLLSEQIQKMKMERHTKSVKNVHEITQLKRKYAMMKTILQQKHQGETL